MQSRVFRIPVVPDALISNVGPTSRKMLTFEAGALLTVFNKSKVRVQTPTFGVASFVFFLLRRGRSIFGVRAASGGPSRLFSSDTSRRRGHFFAEDDGARKSVATVLPYFLISLFPVPIASFPRVGVVSRAVRRPCFPGR